MTDLLKTFMDKASELRSSDDKEMDFVRGIIDSPDFLELTRTNERGAVQIWKMDLLLLKQARRAGNV